MEIFLIILISVLIGLFAIDIILGFINGIFESKRLAELEQRLNTIEALLSDGVGECQVIGFDMGYNNADIE